MKYRIGIGYDIHRLVKKRKLILAGVDVAHTKGLSGHSDADVLLHAICDAILGATGLPDIGEIFPDKDPRFKNISSLKLLKNVYRRVTVRAKIINIDSVIVIQEPKIAPYKDLMRKNIAAVLSLDVGCINIKAKTEERLGKIGTDEAVAAYAVALVKLKNKG